MNILILLSLFTISMLAPNSIIGSAYNNSRRKIKDSNIAILEFRRDNNASTQFNEQKEKCNSAAADKRHIQRLPKSAQANKGTKSPIVGSRAWAITNMK